MTTELGVLVVELPITVTNPLNEWRHWAHVRRVAKFERKLTRRLVAVALGRAYQLEAPPSRPKRIELHVYHGRLFDDDGLVAALKHVRDGLIDAKVIDDDRPSAGHEFVYGQTAGVPDRQRRVTLTITLRPEEAAS